MEEKIKKCEGKPTNIEKDCEPLRVNGNKILTEIDIVNARTLLLHKEVSKLLLENYTPRGTKETLCGTNSQTLTSRRKLLLFKWAGREKKKKETPSYEPKEPEELYPIYHYKD